VIDFIDDVSVTDAADLELPKTTVQRLAKSSVIKFSLIYFVCLCLFVFVLLSCQRALSLPKSRVQRSTLHQKCFFIILLHGKQQSNTSTKFWLTLAQQQCQ